MFAKILLASDGSSDALKATEAAAELARRFGAALTVLHVFTWPMRGMEGIYTYADPAALDLALREARDAVARRTGEVLERTGVAYTTRQEEGHAAEAIVRIAREEGADLIVLGSRGLSGVRAFLLGSVSERVTHHAHCPVLITR